ncbi:hypothetical protein H2248_004159 [Termitomyces sp. 'cryptogamus']|nr:hypothetical protein H2248_004159 [Termitomyces sp. 'cryptogamus']
MAQTTSISATRDVVLVSHTLAQLLQALQLAALSFFSNYNHNPPTQWRYYRCKQYVIISSTLTVAAQVSTVAVTAQVPTVAMPVQAPAAMPVQAPMVAPVQAPTAMPAPMPTQAPATVPVQAPAHVVMDPATMDFCASGAEIEDYPDQHYYVVTIGKKIGVFSS